MTKYLFQRWTEQKTCWWLVRDYYKNKMQIDLPLYLWEPSAQKRSCLINTVIKQTCWHEISEPVRNCVVAMGNKGLVYHVGIYLGECKILHLPQRSNGRVETVGNLKKQHTTLKFYRYEQ